MTTIDFITELFCKVDDQMFQATKHPQALLWPSEAVTLGLLYAIKGVGTKAFYRWLSNNYRPLFPKLPLGLVSFACSDPTRPGLIAFWLLLPCWESSIAMASS
jgi:hypothetical protein